MLELKPESIAALGEELDGKVVAITGGTGSFGQLLTRTLLENFPKLATLVIATSQKLSGQTPDRIESKTLLTDSPAVDGKTSPLGPVQKDNITVVGIRPGEKLHEIMIPGDEGTNTLEFDKHYIICPSSKWFDETKERLIALGGKQMPAGFEYDSGNNPEFVDHEYIIRQTMAIERNAAQIHSSVVKEYAKPWDKYSSETVGKSMNEAVAQAQNAEGA